MANLRYLLGLFLLAPALQLLLQVFLTALAHGLFPELGAIRAGKITALVILILEHGDHILRHSHLESGSTTGAHNGKGLPTGRRGDLLLLHLVDTAGLLIQLAQVLDVVGRQGEDEAVLAGVNDGRGLPGDLLAAHEVLDILGNDDLHTVILTDTLCQLEHEVQGHRELGIDEYVGLVDDHHYLALQAVLGVVVPVLDDLVVNILQHQQHLGVGNGAVAIGQQALEVEHREVLVGGDGGRTVPDVGVPSAGGELCHVVHQSAQDGADVLVVRLLELCQNGVVQVVEHRVVLGPEFGQVRLRRDAMVGVHPVDEAVQVLHGVLVAVREDLLEELLQELQVGGITAGHRGAVRLVIIQRGDDMEGVQTPELGVAHVDELAVKVFRQLRVLVFRVQNEDLAVLGGEVRQQTLGGVGLTGTGLTHDDHVAVDPLAVPAEEVDEHGHTIASTQLDAALIGDMGVDPRVARRQGVAGDAPALTSHGVPTADLPADKGLHLVKFHVVQTEATLLINAAHRLFHIGDGGQLRLGRLHDVVIGPCCRNVIGRHIHVHLQQGFVVLLEGRKQLAQRLDMALQLHAPGVHTGGHILTAQLLQGSVNATDGLDPIHGPALHHDFCARHGHDTGQPRIAHYRRIIDHTHVMGDDVVDLHGPGLDVHRHGHGPLGVILRGELVDLMLVKVKLIRIFQEHRQLLGIQTVRIHLPGPQRIHGGGYLIVKLALITLKQHQVVERCHHLVVIAQIPHLVDAVVHNLHPRLVFFLVQHSVFEGGL